MKHGRKDYDRIQDPANKIGKDEPVFLLRAQDELAALSVIEYAIRAEKWGASKAFVNSVLRQGARMLKWRSKNLSKRPDLPRRKTGKKS